MVGWTNVEGLMEWDLWWGVLCWILILIDGLTVVIRWNSSVKRLPCQLLLICIVSEHRVEQLSLNPLRFVVVDPLSVKAPRGVLG